MIKKVFSQMLIVFYTTFFMGCGIYSFTGSSIPLGAETFQVNYFQNMAGNRPGSTVEPGLDREFTVALQDYILNQKLFVKEAHQKDQYVVIYVGKKKYGIVELIT